VAKVEMDIETSLDPDRVRAALLDFSPRRPELWPGIHPSMYEVYSVGPTSADIKEGTKVPGGMFWAKEHYDWSTPGVITWTVVESNFSSVGSYVSAAITPKPGGGSHVHVTWNRTPTSFMGRIVMAMIVATRGRPIRASIEKTLRRLEATGASQV
jgi:Polyketide cyclase / dehydrase and lipid transport